MSNDLTLQTAIDIRDTCLCLAAQQAARVLARRFDAAFRRLGITNNQFSLMVMLSVPHPPPLTRLGPALSMDRTTVTAALKALDRHGLATIQTDARDRRSRRARLTDAGRAVLDAAIPIWRSEHCALETATPALDGAALRRQLAIVRTSAFKPPPKPEEGDKS